MATTLKQITLVLLIALTGKLGYGQDIKLRILNAQSGLPLANVLVLNNNQNLLAQSNDSGFVTLTKTQLSSTLTFRLYGYEIAQHTATTLANANYVVKMYPAIEELDAITLVSKKRNIEVFYSHFSQTNPPNAIFSGFQDCHILPSAQE